MRPGPNSPPQAWIDRLQAVGGCVLIRQAVVLAALAGTFTGAIPGFSSAAMAQDGTIADDGPGQRERAALPPMPGRPVPIPDTPADPAPATPPQPGAPRDIAFEADALQYESGSDTVSASGNVLLRSADQSVRADAVTWNRTTGQIVATGAIRFVDEDGNQLFTDRLELTDELKAGAMENLLLVFRTGGRMAAVSADRDDAGDIVLDRAAYSACAVENEDGCPIQPSWRITANRVVYDQQSKRIRFTGAYLELFGQRVLPLPRLALSLGGGADSGFFVPTIGYSASNGFELSDSYYWRMADNRDLTLSAYAYSQAAPMVSAQYRQLLTTGAFQATGYLTYGTRVRLGGFTGFPTPQVESEGARGYLFANGRFQLGPKWTLMGSLRIASDRTFLRRYDISREDRLRSMIRAERVADNSYLSIAGWASQALLVDTPQGQVPLALPAIDYRRRLATPVLGGKIELQANTLAITRSGGQDTQRAFARAQWEMKRITPWGQEVTATALVRGDVYHSADNALNPTAVYRGNPGWQGRGIVLGAVDVKWPFIGGFMSGTQILTPRVQLVASPSLRNLALPNEDSRAIELEDTNIFALNRFPGYDRVEDGVRVVYGVDWEANWPGWRIRSTVGQSYRLADEPTLFPDGTGLTNQFSDWVGRTEVRYRDFVKLTHRYRLDKDNFAVRRNELDATIGSDQTYVEIGYMRLNRDVDVAFEDLQDREEVRAAGRIEFLRHWSLFGSAVINLTDREEDPTLTSDGFQPLRTRLGFAYADDCLEFGLTWRRDYIELADSERGSSFRLFFALHNLGF